MGRKLRVYILVLLTVISIISITPARSKISFYAEKIKWPTPGVPEPVVEGGNLTIHLIESKDATGWEALLTPWYGGASELEFLDSKYLDDKSTWILKFKVPKGVLKGGLGDAIASLELRYETPKGRIEIFQPNSVWVLREPPEKLSILHISDTHSPQTIMYEEVLRESFIIDPDLIIVTGDNVHTAGSATDWNMLMPLLVGFIDPKWHVIGNHDYNSPGNPRTYSRIIGYYNYSITIGNFLILVLDSGVDGYVPLDRIEWAERILRENVNKTKILAFHHPIFGDFDLKNKNATFKIESLEDVDKLREYMYSSWRNHYREAREILRLILEYDVRIILSGHIHSDLNVVLVDWKGGKHYFITTVTCSPQKYWDHDWSGYRLITIYSNGTVDEETIYYDPKGLFGYPNSIPLDTGLREYQGDVKTPYKIGYLEYYYTPSNNGSSYSVSVKVVNELDETFEDARLIFVMPGDVEYSEYRWIPSEPKGEFYVFKSEGKLYVVVDKVEIPGNSIIEYTLTAVGDEEPPEDPIISSLDEVKGWYVVTVEARDRGWGVRNVTLKYKVGEGGEWLEPALSDLQSWSGGVLTYKFWLEPVREYKSISVRVIVEDFSGKTTIGEKEFKLVEETTSQTTPQQTTTPSTTSYEPEAATTTTQTTTSVEISTTTPTYTSETTAPRTEATSEIIDFQGQMLVIGSIAIAVVLLVLVLLRRRAS